MIPAARSLLLAAALLAPMATAAAQPADAAAVAEACAPSSAFDSKLAYLEGYRVITGRDGDLQVLPYRIDAKQIPLLKTGKILGMLQLPNSPGRGVQIVIGPPNVDLPMHKAPYREMFIMLSGSVTLKTAKFEALLKPGSVLLFEDVDARIGHGGHIGPCGYTSLSIAP